MPPDDQDDDMRNAIRTAADDIDEDNIDEAGYNSEEEHRRGEAKRKTRPKSDLEGIDNNDEPEVKKLRGKKNVELVADTLANVVESSFLQFLHDHEEYKTRITEMKDQGRTSLWISFSHLSEHLLDLATILSEDYFRFKPNLEIALQKYVRELFPEYLRSEGGDSAEKEFQISFYDLKNVDRVRDLRTDRLGKLISVSGTVTRSSETRPELIVGAFTCSGCGSVVTGVEQEFKYTEPASCQNSMCDVTKKKLDWTLNPEQSTFVDWQKVRVQENANEVPPGSMPRSIEIIVRNESVEKAKPGDKCLFTGSLIVVPDVSKLRAPGDPPGLKTIRQRDGGDDNGVSGIHALGVRDLTYRLAFLACTVQPCDGFGMTSDVVDESGDLSRAEIRNRVQDSFSQDELQELSDMSRQPNLIEKMKRSVAPAIYGHGDVKLGVLLLLFGGVHKRTPEGIHLRGDINVCIVGDPSTAKSQFLRYVCGFAPRAVYTSGKASTAAGLTASVIRDPETGEFCIEAGALMLADNGVCCIDEFDKMDDIDQVAIHEAMEQQTISITKAGIQATLNARTSVLAAANPIHGRYDRSKTLKANLNVGPAIMSRFDLFFVVLDEVDEVNDRAIADHIVEVHRKRCIGEEIQEDYYSSRRGFTAEQMRAYVRLARSIDPQLTPNIQPLLVNYYVKLRQGDIGVGQNRQAYRITVRQLEALIRLSEAIARLHLDEEVKPAYVEKAYQLLKTSIVQVESESISMRTETGEEEIILQNEFQRIGEEVVKYIKACEEAAAADDEFFGVPQTSAVNEILENHMPELTDNDDEIEKARSRVNQVIKLLLTNSVLLEVALPAEFSFIDTPEEEHHLLQSNPNL